MTLDRHLETNTSLLNVTAVWDFYLKNCHLGQEPEYLMQNEELILRKAEKRIFPKRLITSIPLAVKILEAKTLYKGWVKSGWEIDSIDRYVKKKY